MDEKPLDLSKKSVSSTAKAEITTSGKQRETDKTVAKRTSSQVKEFAKQIQNSYKAFKRESMKSGNVSQKSEENDISESQNSIPGLPVKRKISEGPAKNSRVKRHNDLDSASDPQIKIKGKILSDPGCSETSSRDCVSPKPSTSAGSSYSHESTAIDVQPPVEMPFKCEQCEKTFARKRYLQKHTNRRHTKEKRYPCEECEKSFTEKNDLARHSRSHSAERPFKCRYCSKAYVYQNSRNYHENSHGGKKK